MLLDLSPPSIALAFSEPAFVRAFSHKAAPKSGQFLPEVLPIVLDNSFSLLLNRAPGQPVRMRARPMGQFRRQPFMRRAMSILIAGAFASLLILACTAAARAQA